MELTKEFSKYQERKKKKYLKEFGHYFLYEVANDIKILNPSRVTIEPPSKVVEHQVNVKSPFPEEEPKLNFGWVGIVVIGIVMFLLGIIIRGLK